jgi:uridine phosphorylase
MRNVPENPSLLGLRPGLVGRYVLLPGDPGRCERIAARFDSAERVMSTREFETWTGTMAGVPVSVTSTGIGCPSTMIAVEELARLGAGTLIRVGTSGPIQPGHQGGGLAVVTGAIRDEGTTVSVVPIEFPAVADLTVALALREAAEHRGARYYMGVSQSKDSFYGEVEPERMPIARALGERWDAWIGGGAVCSEMEAAALFIGAALHRIRAGAVTLLATGAETPTAYDAAMDLLIDTAADAVRLLIVADAGGRGDA